MSRVIKYTFFLLFCIGCKSLNVRTQESQSEKLNDDLSISLDSSFSGQGYFLSEDGTGFSKQNREGTIRFFYEDESFLGKERKILPLNDYPKNIGKMSFRKSYSNGLISYYHVNNGMTKLNCNGIVYAMKKEVYEEVLYIACDCKTLNKVDQILETVKKRKR